MIPLRSDDNAIQVEPISAICLVILTRMLKQTLEQGQALTDAALERLLPEATQRPASIHQAMRHSVFAGGKRLRPILCMEAGRMVAGSLPAGIEDLGQPSKCCTPIR